MFESCLEKNSGCETGDKQEDADAFFILGIRYSTGRDVEHDLVAARRRIPESARGWQAETTSVKSQSCQAITVFDPARVIDRATYDRPAQYSEGIRHVLVGGTFVVRDEALVDGVAPGRAIRSQQ